MDNLSKESKPMILLVEDDPSHAELIMRSFEDHKIVNDILHLSDGETALDYLFRRNEYQNPEKSPRPKIVLLDLNLPKVNGLEILKEIKDSKALQQLPVIVLTSSQAELDVATAYKTHANSYLVKPADFSKFTKMMENLGFYWLALNYFPEEN